MTMRTAIRVASLLVLLAGAAARVQSQDQPVAQPRSHGSPPRSVREIELADLAADGAEKEDAWAADYRERRTALLQSPAWHLLSRSRRKAILEGLAEDLKAKRNSWREEYRARRLAILEDSGQPGKNHRQGGRPWSLRAQWREKKALLREDYDFGRAALIKELESRPSSLADKAADLEELEAERRNREIRLDDEFWDKNRHPMQGGGERAESWVGIGMGGSHENREGHLQEPAERREMF
jgi:hypothetical protein